MGKLVGIAYSEAALTSLREIEPQKIRQQIAGKISALASNPHPPGSARVQGVTSGLDEVWRIRSGDYRALYIVRENEIIVLDIGHRKDVYRNR